MFLISIDTRSPVEPQNISKTSPGLYLLRQIRDEVHRYAITFHRQSKKKEMTKSIFQDIPGMGTKRVKILWNKFSSIEEIQQSSYEDIQNRTGFSIIVSKAILACSKNNN